MRNFYQIGKVYIWQNLVNEYQYNGKECTVIGNIEEYIDVYGNKKIGQMVDEMWDGAHVMVGKGYLRPKFPPSGEKSISEMFSKPYVKELDKAKEVEENCV